MIKVRFPANIDQDGRVIYPHPRHFFEQATPWKDGYIYAYYSGTDLTGLEEVLQFPWEYQIVAAYPKVRVDFKDSQGNPTSFVVIDPTTNEATVDISISIHDNRGNILPISGRYIVPYRSAIDGRQKGSVIVDIVNGLGTKILKFSRFQTGVYVVRTEDILDANTLNPVSTIVRFDRDEVRIAIVE